MCEKDSSICSAVSFCKVNISRSVPGLLLIIGIIRSIISRPDTSLNKTKLVFLIPARRSIEITSIRAPNGTKPVVDSVVPGIFIVNFAHSCGVSLTEADLFLVNLVLVPARGRSIEDDLIVISTVDSEDSKRHAESNA